MQQQRPNPFAQSLAYKNTNDTFRTTYGTSYLKMPTYEVSPVYQGKQEAASRWFPHDLSPYPAARDESPLRYKRPYQPVSFDEEDEMARQMREREFRSRFEDATLRRDEYREPPPQNRYNYDEELEYQSPRGRQRERGRSETQMRGDKAEVLRSQYDDLVAEGQPMDTHDLKPAFCHNTECFEDKKIPKVKKSERCMNRLGCGHQFCDACMSKMPGSDGPFRDTIRWHYCCRICRKWTSEPKLVRTDPYGRRLVKFHDIGYFKTS